jgi:hypothetical protein
MPTEKFISEVWERNPHGGGLLYQRAGSNTILMEKGFMKLDEYLKHIESLDIKEDDYLALHLRWATSGKTNKITSHPFVVHRQKEVRNILSCESDKHLFMMHNGQIIDLDNSKKISDTQRFARDYMTKIAAHDLYNNEIIQELIEKFIDGSRLLFAHGQYGFLRLGEWVDGDNGLILSKKFTPRSKPNKTWHIPQSYSYYQRSLWEENDRAAEYGYYRCDYCNHYHAEGDVLFSNDYNCFVCHTCNDDYSLGVEQESDDYVECECGNWEVFYSEIDKSNPLAFSKTDKENEYKCNECQKICKNECVC